MWPYKKRKINQLHAYISINEQRVLELNRSSQKKTKCYDLSELQKKKDAHGMHGKSATHCSSIVVKDEKIF
jgi:hypothetical protein